MRTLRSTALVLILSCGGALSAAAQAPADESDAVPRNRPIVNGHELQPRSTGLPNGPADPEAAQLLKSTKDSGPIVPPHDIYGNSLGGNPTLQSPAGNPQKNPAKPQ